MSTATDIVIDEKIRKSSKEPPKYKVIFINDDATPMEWVIELLTTIYKHSQSSAEQITLTIHTEGAGIVGSYSFEIAEQKMHETINESRNRGFPLAVKIEEER